MTLDDLLPRLRCPRSQQPLHREGHALLSPDGVYAYPITDGRVDLQVPPSTLTFTSEWFEPWDELATLCLDPPAPSSATDLPFHLAAPLASVPGDHGNGRWLLEVGCGERLSEPYYTRRGFHYVATDADIRGPGPHVLIDAHNLPFDDACFDLCTSLAVYEHLACPLLAAQEAFRVLKPGGTFFGTSAFVYGFHDRASFHHMTHAGLLWTLRMAGFELERVWPDWSYVDAIPDMGFPGRARAPWRTLARGVLRGLDWTFTRTSQLVRRTCGKAPLDLTARSVHQAGSLSFVAHKP